MTCTRGDLFWMVTPLAGMGSYEILSKILLSKHLPRSSSGSGRRVLNPETEVRILYGVFERTVGFVFNATRRSAKVWHWPCQCCPNFSSLHSLNNWLQSKETPRHATPRRSRRTFAALFALSMGNRESKYKSTAHANANGKIVYGCTASASILHEVQMHFLHR